MFTGDQFSFFKQLLPLNSFTISSRFILSVGLLTPFRGKHYLVKRALVLVFGTHLGLKPSSALWPWASYLTFLSLGFFMEKKRILLFLFYNVLIRFSRRMYVKYLVTCILFVHAQIWLLCYLYTKVKKKKTSQLCSSFFNVLDERSYFFCDVFLISFFLLGLWSLSWFYSLKKTFQPFSGSKSILKLQCIAISKI